MLPTGSQEVETFGPLPGLELRTVRDRTQFKNKCTICTLSCGLVLICRREKSDYLLLHHYLQAHNNGMVIFILFHTATSTSVKPTYISHGYVVGAGVMGPIPVPCSLSTDITS